MAIDNRELKTGTVLKASHKGKTYTCHVTDRGEGQVGFTLADKGMPKGDFKSLSKAASVVKGAKNSEGINGWQFWSLEADFAAGNGHKGPAKTKAPVARKGGKKGRVARKPTAKKAPVARKPTAKKAPRDRKAPRMIAPDKPVGPRKPFACGECGTEYAEQEQATACLDGHRTQAEGAQEVEPQAVEA